MENRNLKEFSKTLSCAMFLCVITYTGTAAFGYFTFGELVTTDILLSYKPDPEVVVAVIFIAMKTYTTYPILLFCGRYIFNIYMYSSLPSLKANPMEGHSSNENRFQMN
jgi:sodium-coupled neutral amino acid transporter 7/8